MFKRSNVLKIGVSALALAAVFGMSELTGTSNWIGTASAQQGQGAGGPGGGDNQGGGNAGGGSENQGGANAGGQGQGGPSSGQGQGGPGEDSDGQGPRAGQGGPNEDGGGKPAWAQEGIPEVELGRLSVARSPDQVLDRAFTEALASFTGDMVDFYNLSLDDMIETLTFEWDTITIIDSPLQNLALMQDALDGSSKLVEDDIVTNDNDTLLALFLGVASDKTIAISPETVIAVTTILGTPITGDDAVALAADAESIRLAVLAGHG
jgi:hypothetical protein